MRTVRFDPRREHNHACVLWSGGRDERLPALDYASASALVASPPQSSHRPVFPFARGSRPRRSRTDRWWRPSGVNRVERRESQNPPLIPRVLRVGGKSGRKFCMLTTRLVHTLLLFLFLFLFLFIIKASTARAIGLYRFYAISILLKFNVTIIIYTKLCNSDLFGKCILQLIISY